MALISWKSISGRFDWSSARAYIEIPLPPPGLSVSSHYWGWPTIFGFTLYSVHHKSLTWMSTTYNIDSRFLYPLGLTPSTARRDPPSMVHAIRLSKLEWFPAHFSRFLRLCCMEYRQASCCCSAPFEWSSALGLYIMFARQLGFFLRQLYRIFSEWTGWLPSYLSMFT